MAETQNRLSADFTDFTDFELRAHRCHPHNPWLKNCAGMRKLP
jgi:hypothetical protein